MSGISTHILDTSKGRPAAGVAVVLERLDGAGWLVIARGETDRDGRCKPLLAADDVMAGRHRLTIGTGDYFGGRGLATLYPEVMVVFSVAAGETDFHLPLLLTANSYTTYRGT